jgi:WD40 repeat protein
MATNYQSLLVGYGDGSVRIIDTLTSNILMTFNSPVSNKCASNCAKWSPDNSKIAIAYSSGDMKIWDVQSGTEIVSCPYHYFGFRRILMSPFSISWHPGNSAIAVGYSDGTIKIYDTNKGKLSNTFKTHISHLYVPTVRCVSFSKDGRRIAAAHANGKIKIWDVRSGNVVKKIEKSSTPSQIIGATFLDWGIDDTVIVAGFTNGNVKFLMFSLVEF